MTTRNRGIDAADLMATDFDALLTPPGFVYDGKPIEDWRGWGAPSRDRLEIVVHAEGRIQQHRHGDLRSIFAGPYLAPLPDPEVNEQMWMVGLTTEDQTTYIWSPVALPWLEEPGPLRFYSPAELLATLDPVRNLWMKFHVQTECGSRSVDGLHWAECERIADEFGFALSDTVGLSRLGR